MIGIGRLVIFKEWVKPECGHSERLNISKMPANTGEVTAMPAIGITAVDLFEHLRVAVVSGVSIGKPVGHDQVNVVGPSEALPD